MTEIEDYIGYLLIKVMKAHRGTAEADLNSAGLYAGQEMVLFHLYAQDGLTGTQLAEALGVEPPTVTRMIQRMESNNLVEKRQDAEDARVSRIYLTDKGRSLQQSVSDIWKTLETRLLKNLTTTEQALLRRLLMQLHENLTDV